MIKRNTMFGITLFRGSLAIMLGMALLLNPEKTRPLLANFMGMYWLVGGFLSLRWGLFGERSNRLSLLIGTLGVLAGLTMLSRGLAVSIISEDMFLIMLGGVIILTGIIHEIEAWQVRTIDGKERVWMGRLLGIFEILLGIILLLSPIYWGTPLYLAATLWAFVGGSILIIDAFQDRHRSLTRLKHE